MLRLLKYLVGICVGISLLVAGVFVYQMHAFWQQILIPAGGKAQVIAIKPNSTAMMFANQLYDLKLIPSKPLFLTALRKHGYISRLKAGIYQLNPAETMAQLLDKVTHGKVMVESFAIIEGTTLKQIINHLQSAPYLQFNPTELANFSANYPSAEGLFLADTYRYDAGSNASSFLKIANANLLSFLTESWQHRNPTLPYKTPYELLIAASILEKEASLVSERRIIAGIIANRIKRKMPLQMDPTVIYALGDHYPGYLIHSDLSIDSPYNTYRYRGLPPTPIAMVGKASIAAAANPEMTNYLYFVAKGDGSHQFSATYEEQKRAINLHKRGKNS